MSYHSVSKNKNWLIQKKEQIYISKPTIIFPYKIIILVNDAWAHSFGKVATNQHAIAERGWNPLNRNILLNAQLRATMTPDEKTAE